MNCHLLTNRYRWMSALGFFLGLVSLLEPTAVRAETVLRRADVESLFNHVEIIPKGRSARRARLSDWLGIGDALRTGASARAELRFNDGSLARIGEYATFRFVPNSRTFRLSNGTVLFLVPPGRGPSQIQTPTAVTGIQGTALVVRHIPSTSHSPERSPTSWGPERRIDSLIDCIEHPQGQANLEAEGSSRFACDTADAGEDSWSATQSSGRTVVMVLTDNPRGPVEVTTSTGQTEALTAGHMAVVEGDTIQVLEFDLALFYETSPLVEGLQLGNPEFEGSGLPTDPVYQEVLDGIATQSEFVPGNFLDPAFLRTEALNASGEAAPQTSAGSAAATAHQSSSLPPASTGMSGAGRVSGSMSRIVERRVLRRPTALPAGLISPSASGSASTHTSSTGTAASVSSIPTQSSGSSTPQAPSTPSIPVQPSTPTTPAQPLQPSTPQTPATPSAPVQPSTPTTPAQPLQPSTPQTPATPTQPLTPSVPEVPATPSVPVQPSIPATPTQPLTPSVPEVPATPPAQAQPTTPAVPEVPATPEVPEVPSTPTIPEIPATPEVPEVPSTPTIPEIPATPEVPEVPSTPTIPEIPATPEVPEVPSTPTFPEIPATPEVPEVPSTPTIPEIPATPEVPEVPSTPTIPEIPATPETPTTPETPVLPPGTIAPAPPFDPTGGITEPPIDSTDGSLETVEP